ncbi:hypothetical protein [Phormidesmis sp. 146-35]
MRFKLPSSQVTHMRPYASQTETRPRISTMPRQQTEAAAYLNLYKLSVEKKRLQYELETIEQRRQRIEKRLAFLDSQVAELEKSAERLGTQAPRVNYPIAKQAVPDVASFNTLFLEY